MHKALRTISGSSVPATAPRNDQAVEISVGDLAVFSHGDGEYLVGDAEAYQPAVDALDGRVGLLRQRESHEGITKIDDELGTSHFETARAGGHYTDACELTGRGDIGDRDKQCVPPCQTARYALEPEGEGHGQVAQRYGDTVTETFGKIAHI